MRVSGKTTRSVLRERSMPVSTFSFAASGPLRVTSTVTSAPEPASARISPARL